MHTRKIERSEWESCLNRLSKALVGKRAEVEVVGLDLGDQIEAAWLPIYGVTFDPKSDMVEISMEGLGHRIRRPHVIHIAESAEGVSSLEIVDADGRRQIVRLKDPIALPPPDRS
jgi:hypothetical protein